ncbi:asparaginyl-tRNA synthetase [Exidia glandulosa HHB12029]|uniref:Asparaginyl-tRNA synthetase n=1 Tax=Exidia glandulosa HHB12029 TaxID=1314781 RepID=A0A166BAS5_EXIGL|nr:asparaginyl-tRNA synthetase [Exidia glandulosa HHB12029]
MLRLGTLSAILGRSRRYSTLPPTIRQLFAAPVPTDPTEITVNGWIKSVRRQKRMSFAVLADGTTDDGLQAVFSDPTLDLDSLTTGASVRLEGALVGSPGARQDRELQVRSFSVVGQCDPESYPIQRKELSTEFLRTLPHLRTRTQAHAHIIRERDRLMRGFHSYFETNGFYHIHTPALTQNDCEGGGEAFALAAPAPDMFGHPAYLTVSAQLHLEAMAAALPRVYTLSPAFRAESSATSRHLSEFWMLEAELAFADSLEDIMALTEGCVRAVLPKASDTDPSPWPRITYAQAVDALAAAHPQVKFEYEPRHGDPLRSDHERWLAEVWANDRPVFVTSYPAAHKPFYMLPNDDGTDTVACFDLLIPRVGELAGGSLREHRLDRLQDAMKRHGVNERGELEWYLDLRRWGSTPHGGFGLGFERLVAFVTGTESVKECVPFPRWAGRWLM